MTKNANQQRKNITEYLIFRFFSFILMWNLGAKILFFLELFMVSMASPFLGLWLFEIVLLRRKILRLYNED